MPLRCLRAGEDILAFDLSTEDWDVLRAENAEKKDLKFPCCDSKVVLKKSRLNTQFFAHAKKGGCTSGPETQEHLLAKSLVAKAVKRAGWSVTTEFRGSTPEGDEWIADVFATKGNAKIAFEIQWSPQEDETTRFRQEQYRKSKVRALWLMRQVNILIDESVPTFHLDLNKETNAFSVWLPDPDGYNPKWLTTRNKGEMGDWRQNISLDSFVDGALNKRLRFMPDHGQTITADVFGASQKCWRCKRWTTIPTSIRFCQLIPGSRYIGYEFDEFAKEGEEASMYIHNKLFAPDLLKKHRIGAIKSRYSKTEERSYISNGCFHCDALSGAFFQQGIREREKLLYSVDMKYDKNLLQDRLSRIKGWGFLLKG